MTAELVPIDADGWQRVASHDGTNIAWRVDGPTGAPTVVLCNGIACDDVHWSGIWPRLADEVQVVRWHYRAHGRSDPPADRAETSVSSVVRDLHRVLDAAGVESAVLVGHSYGVQVICEAFRSLPERVSGLVAVAGAYGHPLGTVRGQDAAGVLLFPLLQAAVRPAPRVTRRLLEAGFRSPLAYWVGRSIGGIGPRAPREVMDAYFAHLARLDPRIMLPMFRAMQQHTSADVLPTIDVPTVVIAGRQDGMTPVRRCRAMAAAVPDARLVELADATHVLPAEEPETVAEEILATVRLTTEGSR